MSRRRLPPNTRIKYGYVEFRKLYKGRMICQTWPEIKEKQAFEEIYKILAKINRNEELFELEEHRITMIQAADIFWERHASKKPNCDGFPIYLARIRQHFGTMFYDQVTDEEVQEFLTWLKTTEFVHPSYKKTPTRVLAAGSINLHHKCLIHIFNAIPKWAELGKIAKVTLPKQRNPASLISQMSESKYVRTRALSLEELERLLGAATPRAATIIRNAIFTLLRKGDLKEANVVLFSNSVRGETQKTKRYYEIAKGGYQIEPMDFTNFDREFERAVKVAKLNDFQFRDLRRTGATWLFRKTNDLGMVQLRLGHTTPNQTKKYLGILDSDNVKASEVLGSLLASLKPTKPDNKLPVTEKACVSCRNIKPLSEFYKNHSHLDGFNSLCKVCSGENSRISMRNRRAVSSAVEHLPHTEGATGSNPVLPTIMPSISSEFGEKFGETGMLKRKNEPINRLEANV
jgi:integrase